MALRHVQKMKLGGLPTRARAELVQLELLGIYTQLIGLLGLSSSHCEIEKMSPSGLPFIRTLLSLFSHVPLVLIFLVLCVPCASSDPRRLLSSLPSSSDSKCAVIFDAGSSGSRVHVYCFDAKMELIKFGDGYELFRKTSPGISSYADNPEKGANSLEPLLNEAIDAVPAGDRAETPVRLGATAGLRLLPGDSAENLLKAVSNLFTKSPFKFKPEWVSIMDGSQEGGFSWVSINYLLGKIGQDYGGTVGTVDLGGGSVQMAYAISDAAASTAPQAIEGDDNYVTKLSLLGKPYHLYVHSYLSYGLLAGRAEILKLSNESESCPCLAKGFQGEYVYNSVTYRAVGSEHGASYRKCKELILKALDTKHSCDHSPCTFGGVWSGGGGAGQKNLYLASFFFDRVMQAGLITDPDAIQAVVKPADFGRLAGEVCKLGVAKIGELYPSLGEVDRPYFCLDLAYEYILLVEGFGLHRHQNVTLVKQINYKNSAVEAQWTLGSAIDVISSSSSA
eukprot:c25613_g1_i1 orf=160-1677(-)